MVYYGVLEIDLGFGRMIEKINFRENRCERKTNGDIEESWKGASWKTQIRVLRKKAKKEIKKMKKGEKLRNGIIWVYCFGFEEKLKIWFSSQKKLEIKKIRKLVVKQFYSKLTILII